MEMPLIFLEKKSNSRIYVENFLKKRGFQVSPVFELGSYDLVIRIYKNKFRDFMCHKRIFNGLFKKRRCI